MLSPLGHSTAVGVTPGSEGISESADGAPFSRAGARCIFSGRLSGASEASFPAWLKSLMTVCCCVTDCYLQNVAISTLLEVINHSQSLALVIEDKMKRYKTAGYNPFSGRLQMVTAPPVAPGVLKVVAERTDFYQVFPTGRRAGGALRPSSQASY